MTTQSHNTRNVRRNTIVPSRNHGGTVSRPALPLPAGARVHVVPPPLPAAAIQKFQSSRSPEPTQPLYWDFDVPKAARTTPTWLRVLGAGIGAGALMAAGYFVAAAHGGHHVATVSPAAQVETHVSAAATVEPVAHDSFVFEAAPAAAELNVSDTPSFMAAVRPEAKQVKTATKAERPAKVSKAKFKRVRAKLAASTKAKAAKVRKVEAKQPLAAQPSRDDVKVGLEGVRFALQDCAQGAHGTAVANLTILGEGRVSYSMVGGDFAGTAAGSCMARALRSASFAPFAGESFTVRYPFSL
jgi:hypothetical protein